MKPIPVFDTNVFSAVERGLISGAEWRALLRHRPGRGWPLSSVTALELLAGIKQVPFKSTKHMLNLAFSLSRGRILEDPRPLICTEILHVPLHPDFVLFSRTIHRHIDVARHARSVDEIARALLGVEIDKHISPDFRTIRVRQQARHCKVREKLKTTNALRDVDIHPDIAAFLKAFVEDRKSGFLFASRNGKPLSASNIIRRHLHPALKQLGYINPHTGTHKAGNHAFRRFRNTFLRNYTACPEGLYKFWMGHAGKDVSDLYDKIKEDVAFRRSWAEKCGYGFELPSVVPNVPRIAEQAEAAKAA